jgi:hypothetical protein
LKNEASEENEEVDRYGDWYLGLVEKEGLKENPVEKKTEEDY